MADNSIENITEEEYETITGFQALILGVTYSSEDNKNHFFVTMQNENTGEYIIDTNIFEVDLNQKYTVKIEHNVENSNHIYTIYKLTKNENDEDVYEEVYKVISENAMSASYTMYIGIDYTYDRDTEIETIKNPLSKGTTNLMEWEVSSEEGTWNTLKTIIHRDTKLLQYYRIPDLYQSSYETRDVNNPNYLISVIENSLKGNGDLIDFSNKNGFSLCTKVKLINTEPKILLAKTDLIGEPYLTFTYFNKTLTFTLYMEDKSFYVSKELTDKEISKYQKEPILLSAILDKSKNLSFYLNNQLLGQFLNIFGNYKNASPYFLTNSLQDEELIKICSSLNTGNLTLNQYVEKIKENQGRYVENIIITEGALSTSDLFYVNCLMDTDY